jgi:hypothetical protein
MSKMGSHDPFGHLKYMLWPKEKLEVKLAVWFPTTKSQGSTQFPCVQVACNIPLQISQQGLQLFFRCHFNRRYAHKGMGPQSRKSPNFGNFSTPIWEGVLRQNAIWMWALWRGTKYIIKGKMMASPKSGSWWVLWVRICLWLNLALIMFQLCTNQLVVWFCAGLCEWLISFHSSYSHLGAPAHPSTPKVLRARERAPTLCCFVVFTSNSLLNVSRSLGAR